MREGQGEWRGRIAEEKEHNPQQASSIHLVNWPTPKVLGHMWLLKAINPGAIVMSAVLASFFFSFILIIVCSALTIYFRLDVASPQMSNLRRLAPKVGSFGSCILINTRNFLLMACG